MFKEKYIALLLSKMMPKSTARGLASSIMEWDSVANAVFMAGAMCERLAHLERAAHPRVVLKVDDGCGCADADISGYDWSGMSFDEHDWLLANMLEMRRMSCGD